MFAPNWVSCWLKVSTWWFSFSLAGTAPATEALLEQGWSSWNCSCRPPASPEMPSMKCPLSMSHHLGMSRLFLVQRSSSIRAISAQAVVHIALAQFSAFAPFDGFASPSSFPAPWQWLSTVHTCATFTVTSHSRHLLNSWLLTDEIPRCSRYGH